MFKRVSSIAVTIAMLLTMVWTFSFASADGLMKLTAVADKTEVHPGDTVTVTVGVENYTQPLQAIAVLGNYDKAVLKNTEVSTTHLSGSGEDAEEVANFPGAVTKNLDRKAKPGEDVAPLYISWANAENQKKKASFTLFTATFEVLADATLDETTVQFFFADRSSTYWDEALEGDIKTVTCEPDVHYVKNADALALSVTCDHEWSAWAHVEETEGADARHTRVCANDATHVETEACSFEKQETSVAPTCTEDGHDDFKCSVCGYEYSVTVPATAEDGDHTGVVTRYYAPTETEEGRWERYCVDCETVLETEVIAAGHPFDDVTDENVWYYDTAVFCKALGIFEGEYNVFYGDRAITRGEFVTVLCRMLGLTDELLEFVPDEDFEEILVGLAEAFGNDDVKVLNDLGDAWYARQAKVMAAIGVVRGYEDSTFRGESAISREEVAVMLYRLVSINAKLEGTDELPTFGDPAEFNDADTVAGWAAEEVAWAGTSGLFQGDDAGNFCPQGNATRAEMATLIERMALSDGSIVVMEPVVEGA